MVVERFCRFEFLKMVLIALAMVMVTGCSQLRMGPMGQRAAAREDAQRRFSSPIAPVEQRNMGLPDILATLNKRQSNVRSLRANLDLTAGAGSSRQVFQGNLVVKPTGFLRVRGTRDQISVFDILVRDDQVRFVSFPYRIYFDGSLAELRANPELMAGLYPEQLVENFTVEQSLIAKLKRHPQPMLYSDRDHYIIRLDAADGTSERWHLRQSDLLVDRYESMIGNRTNAVVRYWAYQVIDHKYLLPTQLVVESPEARTRFSVEVKEMSVNEPVNPVLNQLDVPPGFKAVGKRGR